MLTHTRSVSALLLAAALLGGRHGILGPVTVPSVQSAPESTYVAPLSPTVSVSQVPPVLGEGVIDTDQGRVIFQTTIHGRTATLILDTGTEGNYIPSAEATRLGIPLNGGGLLLDSLPMGKSMRTQVSLEAEDWGENAILMGMPFLTAYDLVFDGPAHRVRLYARQVEGGDTTAVGSKPATPKWFPAGVMPADCLPMEVNQPVVLFTLQVNGHPARGLFDSGSSGASIDIAGARQLGLTLASGHVHPILIPYSMSDAGGGLWEATGTTLTVGGRHLAEDSIMIFRRLPNPVGLLVMGIRTVKDRVVYISFSTRQVCFGAPSPTVTGQVTRRAADSDPLLTVDALQRMTTFWTSYKQEPDSIKQDGMQANGEWIFVTDGQQEGQKRGTNMVSMAAKYPPVAADLKQAGLTAQQWEAYRRALFNALIAGQAGAAAPIIATSVLGQNVVFLSAHQQAFDALKATGESFPDIATINHSTDGP